VNRRDFERAEVVKSTVVTVAGDTRFPGDSKPPLDHDRAGTSGSRCDVVLQALVMTATAR
jgi:hypothetical protein